MIGTIIEPGVVIDPAGTWTTADALAGDTVLAVDDLSGFVEYGSLVLDGAEVPYTSIDSEASTITLAAALAVDVPEGSGVQPLDAMGAVPEDWYVTLDVDDDPDSEGHVVLIPDHMRAGYVVGEAMVGQSVEYGLNPDGSGELLILQRPQTTPTLDLSHADPTTIPDQLPTAPPDTPTLVAGGTIDSLILSAGNLAGTSQVIFHLSASPGFTPGPSTALGPASRTAGEVARALPDGSPLVPDTDYYAVVEAVNAVGSSFSAEVAVRLDQDAASTLFANLLIAAEIVANSVEISGVFRINPDEGLVIEHPDGTRTQINADGSGAHFAGTGSFSELDVTRLAVTGENSVIDGILTLGNGVTAPRPPRVSSAAPEALQTELSAQDWLGLYDDGTRWVTTLNAYGGYVSAVDKTTGAVTPLALLDFGLSGGVVKVGSFWYALGSVGYQWRVRRYASDFSTFDEWAPDDLVLGDKAAIGLDGSGGLLIARRDEDGAMSVTQYAASATKAAGSTTALGAWTASNNLVGVAQGSFDFGATRIIVQADTGTRVFDSSGARQSSEEWNNFLGELNRGFSWDGSRFNVLTSSQRVWKLSPVVTATSRSIQTTFRDSSTTEETDGSEVTSFTQPPRRRFRVEWDLPPDTGGDHWPDSARVYVSGKRQSPEPAVQAKSIDIETPTTGAADIPTVNGFPAAVAPGDLRSTAKTTGGTPLTEFDGAGKARALLMTQSGVVNVTPSAANTDTTLNVTFAHPFDAAPVVHTQAVTGGTTAANQILTCKAHSVTTTGFTILLKRSNTTVTPVGWTANATTQ